MLKNRRFLFWLKIIVVVFAFLIVVSGSVLVFVAADPEPAALFADNVLRPLIGDRAVVSLEGFVFNIQDHLNRIYKHQPSKVNYVTAVKTLAPSVSVVEPPPDITPYVDKANPLKGEGVWERIEGTDLFTTFILTDPLRPYSVVNLVYIPMKDFYIGDVAGTKYPGGSAFVPGTGMVPLSIQQSGKLTAAFNGGFKEKDGHFGMYVNGVTYVPLVKGLATLFIYKDGHVELSAYNGNALAKNVLSARQNGPFLVANGVTSRLTTLGIELWAGTATGGYITWRSGIGETAGGDLIYAVGPSLTPTALADALRLATSENAMELDINAYWVRFTIFAWNNKTKNYTWAPLIKGLANGGSEFLKGFEKDFFYVYKK